MHPSSLNKIRHQMPYPLPSHALQATAAVDEYALFGTLDSSCRGRLLGALLLVCSVAVFFWMRVAALLAGLVQRLSCLDFGEERGTGGASLWCESETVIRCQVTELLLRLQGPGCLGQISGADHIWSYLVIWEPYLDLLQIISGSHIWSLRQSPCRRSRPFCRWGPRVWIATIRDEHLVP